MFSTTRRIYLGRVRSVAWMAVLFRIRIAGTSTVSEHCWPRSMPMCKLVGQRVEGEQLRLDGNQNERRSLSSSALGFGTKKSDPA